jgi:hypothetical protein
MSDIKERILPQFINNFDTKDLFLDTQFVDDTDFYCTVRPALQQLETQLPQEFLNKNLKINIDKTERYTIIQTKILEAFNEPLVIANNNHINHVDIKKLGSHISVTADLHHRLHSMTNAFRNLNNIWFRPYSISIKNRVRLYNVFISPIIRYNLGATPYSKSQLSKLDTHHRRQLRQVLRIFYPQRIHNKQLYNMTNSVPISIIAIEQRWKLFGHILRLHRQAPAQQIFHQYHQLGKGSLRGRPALTLPTLINNDLSELAISLNDQNFINALIHTAQDRKKWQNLTQDIINKQIIKIDQQRKASEKKRNVPTSAELSINYHPWQRAANPQDISTPPGMDYRNNKRSPTTQLPRRTKIRRIRLILTQEN